MRWQFKTEEEWLLHLRFWFAGKAIYGGLAELLAAGGRAPVVDRVQIAKWAYLLADAMLAEREKGETDGGTKD